MGEVDGITWKTFSVVLVVRAPELLHSSSHRLIELDGPSRDANIVRINFQLIRRSQPTGSALVKQDYADLVY